jgi:hypothetical protein
MRLLAPVFVAATVVLFASGVAMGVLHGHALSLARQLRDPASVVCIALVGVHVLVYLKRALISSAKDLIRTSRTSAGGTRVRVYLIATAIAPGLVIGIATVPAQHRWVNLRRDHHHDRNGAGTQHRLSNLGSHSIGDYVCGRREVVAAHENLAWAAAWHPVGCTRADVGGAVSTNDVRCPKQ